MCANHQSDPTYAVRDTATSTTPPICNKSACCNLNITLKLEIQKGIHKAAQSTTTPKAPQHLSHGEAIIEAKLLEFTCPSSACTNHVNAERPSKLCQYLLEKYMMHPRRAHHRTHAIQHQQTKCDRSVTCIVRQELLYVPEGLIVWQLSLKLAW